MIRTFSKHAALVIAATALLIGGCSDEDLEIEDGRAANDLYQSAKKSLDNNAWDKAILTYKQLNTRFPFGRYTEQAHLELAYAYYRAGEPENANATLDRFIRTYPTHPNVDYAFYLKGLISYDEGIGFLEGLMPARVRDRDQTAVRESYNAFDELVRRFPDSRYAPEARQRMQYLRNNMAEYETGVAAYYLRREAYVAAANRSRYVLTTYPGSASQADALAILNQAYIGLDLPELADDTMKVLVLNYPDHPWVEGRQSDRSFWSKLWPFD